MNQLTSRTGWTALVLVGTLAVLSSSTAEKAPMPECCPHGSFIVVSPGQKTICRAWKMPDFPAGAVDDTTTTPSSPSSTTSATSSTQPATSSPSSTTTNAASSTQTPPPASSSATTTNAPSSTQTPPASSSSSTSATQTPPPPPPPSTTPSSVPSTTTTKSPVTVGSMLESMSQLAQPSGTTTTLADVAAADADNSTHQPESSTHATPGDSALRMPCAEFYLVNSQEEAHAGRTVSVDAKTNELTDSDGLRVSPGEYCAGSIVTMEGPVPAFLVCFEQSPATAALTGATINVVLLGLSAFFLAATLYVYHVAAFTLRATALDDAIVVSVRYLLAVMVLLGCTNINNLHANHNAGGPTAVHSFLCTILGYPLYWCVLSYFAWLNVVCATAVWTTIGHVPYRRWRICARVYTVTTAGLVMTLAFRAHIIQVAAGLAGPVCWFHSRADQAAFLYGPVGTMLALNALMCGYIGWHLLRKPSAGARSSRRWNRLTKQAMSVRVRVFMCLRLCLVGGLMWLLELGSFVFAPPNPLDMPWIWTLVDMFNYLQGLLVFVVLVLCRNRAMNALAEMSFCGRRLAIPKTCTNLPDAEYDELDHSTVVSFVNTRGADEASERANPLMNSERKTTDL